jgi:regulatory protein
MNCFDYALYYTNRYPKTSYELRLQLRKKKYSEEQIESTLTLLTDKNYINDYEFTKLYLSSEVVKKWKPLYTVRTKLRQKWIEPKMLDEVTDRLRDEIYEGIYTRIEKEMEKLKAKWMTWFDIIRKLQTRWYHLRDIKKVIERKQIIDEE